MAASAGGRHAPSRAEWVAPTFPGGRSLCFQTSITSNSRTSTRRTFYSQVHVLYRAEWRARGNSSFRFQCVLRGQCNKRCGNARSCRRRSIFERLSTDAFIHCPVDLCPLSFHYLSHATVARFWQPKCVSGSLVATLHRQGVERRRATYRADMVRQDTTQLDRQRSHVEGRLTLLRGTRDQGVAQSTAGATMEMACGQRSARQLQRTAHISAP